MGAKWEGLPTTSLLFPEFGTVMNNNSPNTNKDSSNGDRPEAKLTVTDNIWLEAVKPECLVFILDFADKTAFKKEFGVTPEIAEDIFYTQKEILNEKGFDYIHFGKIRKLIELGVYTPTEEDKLNHLKKHLKDRTVDYLRSRSRKKRNYRLECSLSNERLNTIPDTQKSSQLERLQAREDLDHLVSVVGSSLQLSTKEEIIFRVMIEKHPIHPRSGLFKSDLVYDAMNQKERLVFTQTEYPTTDNERRAKRIIYNCLKKLLTDIRHFFGDDMGYIGCV